MSKPLILVTTGRSNLQAAWNEPQSIRTGCNVDYVHSVINAGGAPVLLPRMDDIDSARSAIDVADGLILTGGGDVVSLNYGEEPHPRSKWCDPVRDMIELEAVRHALKRGIPILGICRGMQLLNVEAGGTLIQDIPSQTPGACQHYTAAVDAIQAHTIHIEPDSLLAELFNQTVFTVNSYHHQAVKSVGSSYKITARAKDGVAEAMESVDGKPILAVQFHPEEMTTIVPEFHALFTWLVTRAMEFRTRS